MLKWGFEGRSERRFSWHLGKCGGAFAEQLTKKALFIVIKMWVTFPCSVLLCSLLCKGSSLRVGVGVGGVFFFPELCRRKDFYPEERCSFSKKVNNDRLGSFRLYFDSFLMLH